MIGKTNVGGGGEQSPYPEFTYTGAYTLIDDSETTGNEGDWRIKFLTSGTLKFTSFGKGAGYIDEFLVGGGGGGGSYNSGSGSSWFGCGGGGGGGYTLTVTGQLLQKKKDYELVVGEQVEIKTDGNDTYISLDGTVLNIAHGGKQGGSQGSYCVGGAGGSGGGTAYYPYNAGGGGSNGSNGGYGGGAGQGTTTKEFAESTGTLYSGGGGGGEGDAGSGVNAQGGAGGGGNAPYGNGATNLGGGAGSGGKGGSGIIVIRNMR